MRAGPRRRSRALAAAVVIVALAPSLAWAAGDAERGHALARIWCSSCHLVDKEGSGSATSAKDVAPPFPAIAARGAQIDARAFLEAPHPPMPNFDLARQQIDDIIAYLNSLAAH